MRRSFFSRFVQDQSAAIAPLYAIGFTAFVSLSAIGFDYGRLMALDTELQNASDQAALAAATQLDGGDDAMTRARDAANSAFADATKATNNETRFANDGQGRPITGLTFRFFDGYEDDAMGNELTNDTEGADAEVVEVTVNARQVFYALTPLVGAINSGDVIGRALAGLQSATCNVPPMMFCIPQISGGVDLTFPTEADIGRGLHLHTNANQSDDWAPGNFGFLDIDYGPTPGNPNHTLGLNSAFAGCTGDVIESKTGVRDPESDALNSRFDMYNSSVNNNSCDGAGNFCPAENVRRNWVNVQSRNNVRFSDLAGLTCNTNPSNSGWTKVESLPTTPSTDDLLQSPGTQQFPKDDCLLSQACGQVLGDGDWDGDAYMAKFHPGVSLSTAAPNGTRWEVYNWEIENKATALPSPNKVGYYADYRNGTGANARYNVELYCSFPQPVIGTARPASDTQKDRRLLTVAAVDCTGLHGGSPVKILRWVDLFLAQPTPVTGSDKSFFTEIVGPARRANGDSGFQYFGRKKAVLIR